MATILGVFVGVYAFINNRVIRSEMAATRLLLDKMDQVLERTSQGLEKMSQGLEKMSQGLEKMSQGQEKMTELIVADGERTRELVRQFRSA
ncbi:MAG: hypothetical protein M1339_05065, partial [Bacteroidetes bacterium]|nr:hypothetical protein [Bacteroidota bacterium]